MCYKCNFYSVLWCIDLCNMALTRGHPFIKRPDFPFPKGGLIRGGPLYEMLLEVYYY